MGNLKKAIITASQEDLRDEGLYPDFCRTGMKIYVEDISEKCDYYTYYITPGNMAGTISKSFVELGGR